ncbi:hypothetical protein C8R43DRAFT_1042363 [Mycena crocata]|nr:hypothetical protein C8R43DRAFT_1042363 [Mycena crocata]
MSPLHHDALPTELWLEIFDHLDGRAYVVSHAPFQPLPGLASDVHSTFTAVVLVCRNWRAWAIALLYRNVKLSESIRFPEVIDVHRRYGQWVRRAVVPYSTTVTETCKPMPCTEVLRLCPNLEVLVRPLYATSLVRNLRFDFDATCPPLLSLKRLDWFNYREASRSGGINSLTEVLSAAPNLEYLFIGEPRRGDFTPFHGLAGSIYLPSLRTLRLHISNVLLLRHITHRWAMPELENLVVDAPPIVGVNSMESMSMIWEALGPQLRVVEFGKHLRFLLDQTLTPCLEGCPALHELNYYIFITSPPIMDDPRAVYESITSIGVHLSETPFLGDTQEEWVQLEQHFNAFAGDMFPNLRHLRLFGMQEWMFVDKRFTSLYQQVGDTGCTIEFPDGTPL